MRGFFNGVVFTLALLLGAAFAAVQLGAIPSSADAKPPAVEEWAAKRSLHASLDRERAGVANPLPVTDENLTAGVQLYAANCAVCHGASDAKSSTLAKGFYIESPQLAKDGVEDDPEAVTFLKIKHGIRFTAMPAFGANLSETKIWQIASFVKRMDKLPAAVEAQWKKVSSAAPSPEP